MPQCKFSLYLKKAGLASRNIVHFLKKVILRCIGLCFHYHHLYLLSRLDQPLIQRIPAGLSSTVACLDITYKEPCLLPQAHQPEHPYPPQSPQLAYAEYSADTVAVPSSSAFKGVPSSQRVETQATHPEHLPGAPTGNEHLSDQIGNCQKGSPSSADSSTGEKFLQELIDIQKDQQQHNERFMIFQQSRDHQLQELLSQHQKLFLTLSLPSTKVQVFDGDPANYCSFVRSFKSLIESKTMNSNTRLY